MVFLPRRSRTRRKRSAHLMNGRTRQVRHRNRTSLRFRVERSTRFVEELCLVRPHYTQQRTKSLRTKRSALSSFMNTLANANLCC